MKVALDVDGVLADFNTGILRLAATRGWATYFPRTQADIKEWGYGDPVRFKELFESVRYDAMFWLELPTMSDLVLPLPFEVVGYVTHRPVASWVTEDWLRRHGLPRAPVHTCRETTDKLSLVCDFDADCFVDDKPDTVAHMNDGGHLCYVMDRPWNQELDPKYPRIKSLHDLGRSEKKNV